MSVEANEVVDVIDNKIIFGIVLEESNQGNIEIPYYYIF